MSISENHTAFVDPAAVAIDLSRMFTVTPGSGDPAYLVLTTLDRDEYTAGATGATGTLTGNGHTASFQNIGSDGRGTGIVFTYQPSTGQYYNATYGDFDQLAYASSASAGDVTDLSVFGTGSLSLANAYASNAWDMMQVDPTGYLGTAAVVTQPGFAGTVPAQATPGSIAATARGFVGQDWNEDGCWVLCSTIAADAGAALPMQTTLIGLPGQSNGEWIVAFDGPAGQSGNWQAMAKAGEMVVIGTPGGGGHITTVVSGSGSSAMLVDNAVFETGSGQVENPANDGSSSDIVIQPPHPASQEWAGVQADTVVIYELDTPVVADAVASDSLPFAASQSLASLFTASDPANKAITEWQVYNSVATDALVLGATDYTGDLSPSAALTVGSLGSVSLLAGDAAATDTLEARAYNGSYWGDWQPLAVTIGGAATPPVLETQTPKQTWTEGKTVSLALPANTFSDPQGESLAYTATQASGAALPAWLTFNGATETFSGTAPVSAENLSIKVTATDTSGLTAAETFAASVVPPSAPAGVPGITVTPTPGQVWHDGQAVDFQVPPGTFSDGLGLPLRFSAFEVGGPNVTSWLYFNPNTDTLFGNVPAYEHGTVELAVYATDPLHLTAADLFSVTFARGAEHGGFSSTVVSPGLGLLFNPPEPSNILAFHS